MAADETTCTVTAWAASIAEADPVDILAHTATV